MRQSLAGAAARGMSTGSTAALKQELLAAGDIEGLMALNRSLYGTAVMGPEDDADDDADDHDDESDDSDDEDDDVDDEDDDKGSKKPDAKSRRIQELAAESKKHRLKARDYRRERDEALAELEKLKNGKGKPASKTKETEGEEDEGDDLSAELKAENDRLKEQLVSQQLRQSFTDLTTGSKALAEFKNPAKAFKLLDLDDVEIVDGEVEGLDEAIKALAKSDPYLLVSKDEDDEDDSDRRRRRSTGQPTGPRSTKANPEREKLISKYPALRR